MTSPKVLTVMMESRNAGSLSKDFWLPIKQQFAQLLEQRVRSLKISSKQGTVYGKGQKHTAASWTPSMTAGNKLCYYLNDFQKETTGE